MDNFSTAVPLCFEPTHIISLSGMMLLQHQASNESLSPKSVMSTMVDKNPVFATPSQGCRISLRMATSDRGKHKVSIGILSFVNIGLMTTAEERREVSLPLPTSPKYEDHAYTPEYSREDDRTASLTSIPQVLHKLLAMLFDTS